MCVPVFYGHLTYASHRCWTAFIKKGVWLAAQAWRDQYGQAIRHAAIKHSGGERVVYHREGMDPVELIDWKKLELSEGKGSTTIYQGPNGEIYEDLKEAFDQFRASRSADEKDVKPILGIM